MERDLAKKWSAQQSSAPQSKQAQRADAPWIAKGLVVKASAPPPPPSTPKQILKQA